jgi:hypothetical protein
MVDPTEIAKINHFLSLMSPLIEGLAKMLFQSAGVEVSEEGYGPNVVFSLKTGEKDAKFYFHNLFLEIATVDRDQRPLRFDERLADFDFLVHKIIHCVEGKLRVFLLLLDENDIDAALDRIAGDAKSYERIRIWRLNGNGAPRGQRRQ